MGEAASWKPEERRYKEEKGELNITVASKSKDEITISITDDGIGREKSKALKTENQKKQ
mgnify:CR=1 FL=1